MTKLVLIDDDAALVTALTLALEDAGYGVVTARDGREGLRIIEQTAPSLVITDVNMPALDGFSLCRLVRAKGNRVPIIVLTSRDNEVDEALSLELGADDFVSKPFSTRVLLARIAALLRREEALLVATVVSSSVGALTLSADRLEVRWREVLVATTVTEFRLIEALSRRPGVVLSRDVLIDACRGDDAVVGDRLIDTYVRRLRRKFEGVDPAFEGIETVIGAGYRWRA
jgi:DNA-binding response OmpR family regulator